MIDIKNTPWNLYEIDNPTEEECLISVKANPWYVFMVKNLTPAIIKLVDPLYIQLWYDLRTLNFDYDSQPQNDKYIIYSWVRGNISLFDNITKKDIINDLSIEHFYPLFKHHFKQELRANKLEKL